MTNWSFLNGHCPLDNILIVEIIIINLTHYDESKIKKI